jgi:glycosyltransferase involved in cell wall biosynthesis
MKIVHVGNVWKGWGGTEATVRTLLKEMRARGHEIVVVAWETSFQRTSERPKSVDGVSELIVEIPKKEDETRHQYLKRLYLQALDRVIDICDSDTVVYTVLFNHPDLWKRLSEKNIAMVHEYNMPRQPKVNNGHVKYVFNSKWTRSWYPHLSGPVINPLIDFREFDVDISRKMGIIGMVNPCLVKGINIVRQLAIDNPDWQFNIVGGWAHLRDPIRMVEWPTLANVDYLYHPAKISDFYNNCDIVIMPTQDGHDESFGRVALEAMYHKCASVSSWKDGLPEAMDGAGELVGDYGNYEAWQTAIEKVWDNIDAYIAAGYDRAQRYDYERDVDRWEEVFRGALHAGN